MRDVRLTRGARDAARVLLPRVCGVRGCATAPNERKPFCSEHLDALPYVRALKAEVARRDAELEAAARQGWAAVDPHGSRARDFLDALRAHGAQPERRLVGLALSDYDPNAQGEEAQERARVRREAGESYVEALRRARLVTVVVTRSIRGGPLRIVTLARPEPATPARVEGGAGRKAARA